MTYNDLFYFIRLDALLILISSFKRSIVKQLPSLLTQFHIY